MAQKYCETFADTDFPWDVIVLWRNKYWIITQTKNAWAKKIPFIFKSKRYRKIALSKDVYDWLGIPLDEETGS